MKPEHKLRMIRKAYGFTQTQMAAKLHICQSAYGKLERDQTAMTVQRAKQLAGIFKVDPRVFTTDEDIVIITTEDHKIQVLFTSELNKTSLAEHPLNHLLNELKAFIKKEIQQGFKAFRKRNGKLKAVWWLFINAASVTFEIAADGLLPALAA